MKKSADKIKEENIEFTKASMVKWFDPGQLFNTASRVLISSIFSTYADKRESFGAAKVEDYDYSKKEGVWLDYIADIGDGWNPTYYTAYLLAKPNLFLKGKSTNRGDILIMGGDQVYPTATREEYQNRLWGPYECALPKEKFKGPKPHLFAIPGNHDWYDGLNNFIKFFCQQRDIGAWETRQHRSYFAIKLTASCWLWGIDIQLNSDIDKPQLDYFKDIATKKMQDNDQVILCTAEPAWVSCDKEQAKEKYEKLAYFRRSYIEAIEYDENPDSQGNSKIRKLNLVLLLAGDKHHYARYNHYVDGKQETYHITAGGGGTFLHPTHNLSDTISWHNKHSDKEEKFILQKSFPDKETSRNLIFQNTKFPFKNLTFCILLGSVYVLLGWILQSSSIVYDVNFNVKQSLHNLISAENLNFIQTSKVFGKVLLHTPAALLLILLLVVGFMRFADTYSSNKKRLIAFFGVIHGLLHAIMGFYVVWLFSLLMGRLPANSNDLIYTASFIIATIFMLVIGGMLGGFLTGAYLMFTNLCFQVHDNEAFSAFRYQHYKNFLRLHITADKIIIYPVGIRDVPLEWQKSKDPASPSYFEPLNDNQPTPRYELIEDAPLEINIAPVVKEKTDTSLKPELV